MSGCIVSHSEITTQVGRGDIEIVYRTKVPKRDGKVAFERLEQSFQQVPQGTSLQIP